MAVKWKYNLLKSLGYCTCCENKKAEPGKTRCARCNEKKRACNRMYAERRLMKGNGKEANVHD